MLEKERACQTTDFADFIREHSASIIQKQQEQQKSSSRTSSNFMNHYKLVNRIGGVELE
jgi:membrane-bound lytic murein transglycosylase MltF